MPISKLSSATKDLIVIAVVSFLVFVLSYFFNIFGFIVKFLQKHPSAVTFVDEVVTLLLTLSISFVVFSWRRWRELKEETAQRIKAQEELIKIAHTKAEIERIISKQLRVEIEERKQV